MKKPIPHYVKLGTKPALVVYKYNYSIQAGKKIFARLEEEKQYYRCVVTEINENGVIFLSWI